jgi:hypothetical protein
LFFAAGFVRAQLVAEEQVGQGVIYRQYRYASLFNAKQEFFVLDVDLNNPAVDIKFPYARGSAATPPDPYVGTSVFAARTPGAVAAVNAQFFSISPQTGAVEFLRVGGSIIFNAGGDRALARAANGVVHIVNRPGAGWPSLNGYPDVMASHPTLVTNRVPRTDFPNDSFNNRNPRTAVGWTYDNHLIFLVVDGRSTRAAGMSTTELAATMVTLGDIRSAFNFDGGGSSTMWAGGVIRNSPSDGSQRSVTDAVVITSIPPVNSDVIVDNIDARVVGAWQTGTSSGDRYGSNYIFKSPGDGSAYVEFTPDLPSAGQYQVYEMHPQGGNRTTAAPHTIVHDGGVATVPVNQQVNGGRWNYVGTFPFAAGTAGSVRISDAYTTGSVVIADAVKFVKIPAENSLRIFGGLTSGAEENIFALDVEKTDGSSGRIDLRDAVRAARQAAGLDP